MVVAAAVPAAAEARPEQAAVAPDEAAQGAQAFRGVPADRGAADRDLDRANVGPGEARAAAVAKVVPRAAAGPAATRAAPVGRAAAPATVDVTGTAEAATEDADLIVHRAATDSPMRRSRRFLRLPKGCLATLWSL
ncbi:MAG: hypothetical protein GY722_10040 [bacterium]|nr:hypothetical protein [bacterium]